MDHARLLVIQGGSLIGADVESAKAVEWRAIQAGGADRMDDDDDDDARCNLSATAFQIQTIRAPILILPSESC